MKKILSFVLILAIILLCIPNVALAALSPIYDETFNNNKGIFYANGNDIVIKKENNNTVVTWNGGKQIVPETVTIVGGGKEGTNIENTKIVMEAGTVGLIYGGGASLVSNNIAKVNNSKITINGGTILQTIYGGGLLFTTTNNSDVTINGGRIGAICGGGAASATISGTTYAAGTEANPELSKSRVENTKVTINGGTIDYTPSNYGTVFGGGQGYSYVGNANVIINNGDLSKAYVTAAGSNGYTRLGKITINGGDIYLVQTVNRGKIETARVEILGGTIEKAYIGGEIDPSVTGIVEKVEFSVLDGIIKNLYQGTSDGIGIVIDGDNYTVLIAEGKVENTTILKEENIIKYRVIIDEKDLKIYNGDTKKLHYKIETQPAGYERLFLSKEIKWTTEDNSIVDVEDGKIIAKSTGVTQIKANLLDEEDSIYVEVQRRPIINEFIHLITISILISILVVIVSRKIYE